MSTAHICAIGEKCICAQNCVLIVNVQFPRTPMLQKLSTDVNKYLILSMLRVELVSMCAKNNLCDKNDKNAAMIQIHIPLPQEENVIHCYFKFTVHLANT